MPLPGVRKAAADAGLLRYFSGQPCVNGHLSERFTCSGSCVDCNAEKRRADLPKHRAACKKSYRKHRPAVLEWQKQYREDNPDAIKLRKQRWRRENPDADRTYNLNRRALLASVGGKVTGAEIRAIIDRQRGRCAACGAKAKLEMDHILPLALGGRTEASNFQGLCKPCNIRKRSQHPIEFNRSRGLLL